MAEAVARARIVEQPAETAKAKQKERNLKFHSPRSQRTARLRAIAELPFASACPNVAQGNPDARKRERDDA
eukprot:11200236-Lingulodinium_polyedra.AAC.1